MRKNLLELLFGENVARPPGRSLGDDVVRLFEEAAEMETDQLKSVKKPLATALKAIGVSTKVECGPDDCEIVCDDAVCHRKNLRLLADADNMHKLAEMGWVVANGGDAGMGNEAPDYKIAFIALNQLDAAPENSAKVPDLDTILKDAQKFAATAPEHDDKMNPVEYDDKTSDNRKKGVGKEADGKAPEGKPKGSTAESKRSTSASRLASRLLDETNLDEMTGCSAIPAVDGPPLGIAGQQPSRARPLLNKSPSRNPAVHSGSIKKKFNVKREPHR